MSKFTYNLAMTSFNVYVHCLINHYEYLAPKNKVMIYFLTYTMHFKKCRAVFSHVRMELF